MESLLHAGSRTTAPAAAQAEYDTVRDRPVHPARRCTFLNPALTGGPEGEHETEGHHSRQFITKQPKPGQMGRFPAPNTHIQSH